MVLQPAAFLSCSTIPGYSCYRNFCASDSAKHFKPPTCGPELAELRLGGSTVAERIGLAERWCDSNASCSGFALDPDSPVTLAYRSANFTAAAVANSLVEGAAAASADPAGSDAAQARPSSAAHAQSGLGSMQERPRMPAERLVHAVYRPL